MTKHREIIEQVRAQAFVLPDDEGRVVHSFLGSFGANWDVEDVVTMINEAKEVAWVNNVLDHNLRVTAANGKAYFFQVDQEDKR